MSPDSRTLYYDTSYSNNIFKSGFTSEVVVNVYPDIEDIVQNYNYKLLDDSSHIVMSVLIRDEDIVYKKLMEEKESVRKRIKELLRKVDAPLKNHFIKEFSFLDYRERSTGKERFDIESRILGEWTKRGISCMQILEKHDKSLVYKRLNSMNLGRIMRNNSFANLQYMQMLDVISSIRDVAKRENDPSLLHPDLLPKNFLYLFDENKTIAIDPGLKLKKMPLEEIDAKINLVFIYDLNTYERGPEYIDRFLDILNKSEKKFLKETNVPATIDAMLYFKTKACIIDIIRGTNNISFYKVYSPCNTAKINRIIDRHL